MSDFGPFHEYFQDAYQRSILFFDILRERGNTYRERKEQSVPNVLDFGTELILDGRTLKRPVNYGLVRIVPPEGTKTDPAKRPFVVIDPRAGHGPGIGGMKQDSEIGVALAAGHACYFIGFSPEPVAGQTLEDVWTAEAVFVQTVADHHPEANGKPALIANCQAGWQTIIMAATNPDVPGPLVLVGSPLSYWAGVHGKNPMRYLGGLLGGTWLTEMAGDMGAGIFDGANLVANFESLDPANTYVTKPYNVYAKADTEGERFLDFETWWGSPVVLNAEEMDWIADNLFVGNRLTSGDLRAADGTQVDLRNVKSPIIVFCSWGDNITPPQQALGWITDIYRDDADLVANGQTIVYTLHQSIGHLGIFVSGKVADKEHREITTCMDMIDLMPPGLYEAVIEDVDEATENVALIEGRYLFSLRPRKLDDIRALGENSREDELRFAAAERVSQINRRLYERYAAPFIRSVVTAEAAQMVRDLHPNRLRFAIFSDQNPAMSLVKPAAEAARRERAEVSADNPLLAAEKAFIASLESAWETWGSARDKMAEQLFLHAYGSPLLQALVGLDPDQLPEQRRMGEDVVRKQTQAQRRAEIERKFDAGGQVEAVLRAVSYVLQAEGQVDERTAAVLRKLHQARSSKAALTVAEFKGVLREQSLLLKLDPNRTISSIPKLLSKDDEQRRSALAAVHEMIAAQGELSDEGKRRLAHVEKLFAPPSPAAKKKAAGHAAS